jgi:hypothetical protein
MMRRFQEETVDVKLSRFRKPLQRRVKEKTNWQFLGGSLIAWIGLAVSLTTAFYSLIYYSDQLTVVVHPTFWQHVEGLVGVQVPRKITYVNSGSRPVAVLNVHMVAAQQAVQTEPVDCSHGQFELIEVVSDQNVVIKPYDTTTRDLAPVDAEQNIRMFAMSDLNRKEYRANPRLVVCLVFEMVATNTAGWRKTIEIARVGGEEAHDSNNLTQHYLIKRNTFWTSIGGDGEASRLDMFLMSKEASVTHPPWPEGPR